MECSRKRSKDHLWCIINYYCYTTFFLLYTCIPTFSNDYYSKWRIIFVRVVGESVGAKERNWNGRNPCNRILVFGQW